MRRPPTRGKYAFSLYSYRMYARNMKYEKFVSFENKGCLLDTTFLDIFSRLSRGGMMNVLGVQVIKYHDFRDNFLKS